MTSVNVTEARDFYEAIFLLGNVNASSSISLLNTVVCSVVTPSSFVYGNYIDASRFVQLEDMECNFQPLNITFQVLLAETIYGIFIIFFTFLYIFTSLLLCLHLSPSLYDVVPGHKQGAQQAAWLHCGHQDTQPAGWQRS